MAIFKINDNFGKSPRAISNCAAYILRPDAQCNGAYEISSYFPYDDITPANIRKSFMRDKEKWGKLEGRQYFHAELSFHPDERPSDFELLEIAREMSRTVFCGHQVFYAVHHNTDSIHIHFLGNSVSYRDGLMFHTTNADIRSHQKEVAKILKKHNLHVPEKGKDFYGNDLDPDTVIAWNKKKYQTLTKEKAPKQPSQSNVDLFKLVLLIMKNLLLAKSIADFIRRMKYDTWKVKWDQNRKHITFESEATGRKFRASNIDKTFGPKLHYVFGNDFELDKKHMKKILDMPLEERQEKFSSRYDQLTKEGESWFPNTAQSLNLISTKSKAWVPPKHNIEDINR